MTRRSSFHGKFTALAVALVVIATTSTVAAQQWAPPQEAPTITPRNTGRRGTGGGTPADTRGTFMLDAALTVGSQDFGIADVDYTLFSMLLGFRYDILPVFELEVQGGFTLLSPDEADTEVDLSNILIGGFYVVRSASWRLRIGGALGLPTAQIDEDDEGAAINLANLYASAGQRGGFDFAIWSPETFSLQIPSARIVWYPSPEISLMGEAAFTLLIDVSDFDRDTGIGLQLAGDFGFHPSPVISLGARLNLVMVAEDYLGDDEFQASIEPHFRVNFGAGFFHARLTINLDHPYGFAFDDNRLWAIHLGGGADF